MTCELVKQLITEWSRTRNQPFPYLRVGDHLASCTSCLSWSTQIAYRPGERYVRSLRLRLSEVLGYLGSSLLAAWSNDQDVKIRFCVAPGSLPETRRRALGFLRRYSSFNPETRDEAERIQQMIPGQRGNPKSEIRNPKSSSRTDSVLATLEPYELTRYFFETARQVAQAESGVRGRGSGVRADSRPSHPPRLDLLVNLGIIENYQGQNEQSAGLDSSAGAHFARAREYFGQVIEAGPGGTRAGQAAGSRTLLSESDKTSLISARINLAGTEVQQGRYSEVSLHRAIDLLFEARRLVAELGLAEADFTSIYSNLLIGYLRLFLDYGIKEGYAQAVLLAQEICAAQALAPVFLKECISEGADPELTGLLAKPAAQELASYLSQQARG